MMFFGKRRDSDRAVRKDMDRAVRKAMNVRFGWPTLQKFLDCRTARDPDDPNPCKDYLTGVRACYRTYFNETDHGSGPFRTAVTFRTARTYDPQFTLEWDGDSPAEREWAEDFIKLNRLRAIQGTRMALAAELQGQVLLELEPGDNFVKVGLTHLVDIDSDVDQQELGYKTSRSEEVQNKDKARYEFAMFCAYRYDSQNKVFRTPTIAPVLIRYCTAYDEAQSRTRRVNGLFAAPTFVTEHAEEEERSRFGNWVKEKVWKLGRALHLLKTGAGPAAYFVQPETSGTEALSQERHDAIKALSGQAGVPTFKFGYAEDWSNRSTAELVEQAALFDNHRKTWELTLENLFKKAMRLHNEAFNTSMDPGRLKGVCMNTLPPELQIQYREILFQDVKERLIPLSFYLEHHPMVDNPSEVLALRREEETERLNRSREIFSSIGAEDEEDEGGENDEP